MNHVPDEILTAIDEFGEGCLFGTLDPIGGRLRSELRIEVVPEDASTATCRYETEHTQSPPTLRDRGSFVTTIVDGVDERLQKWGIEPPDEYTLVTSVDGSHHYEGTLQLP
jgi:hypothetical protein